MMNIGLFSRNVHPFMVILLLTLLLSASEAGVAQDLGYFWVTSQPRYALVYLDGEYTNSITPTPKLLLAGPGEHKIELSKQGYKLYQDEITIEPGKALKINVILAELGSAETSRLASKRYIEAYITVESKPPGADVYMDDKLMGKTPMDREIQPGEPRDIGLRVVKPGYNVHEETIAWADIKARAKIYVSAELKPVKQVVDSAPSGKAQEDRRFTMNSQVIVLFIALAVILAILAARIIIRLRQRTRD